MMTTREIIELVDYYDDKCKRIYEETQDTLSDVNSTLEYLEHSIRLIKEKLKIKDNFDDM